MASKEDASQSLLLSIQLRKQVTEKALKWSSQTKNLNGLVKNTHPIMPKIDEVGEKDS
jgi:hypothetical protein